MNYNLWWGRALAAQESSSGLHHDFHDNLYVLLCGRKRFLLVSPKYALQLDTVGDIEKVLPNTTRIQTTRDLRLVVGFRLS
jgi:hypothetical protein